MMVSTMKYLHGLTRKERRDRAVGWFKHHERRLSDHPDYGQRWQRFVRRFEQATAVAKVVSVVVLAALLVLMSVLTGHPAWLIGLVATAFIIPARFREAAVVVAIGAGIIFLCWISEKTTNLDSDQYSSEGLYLNGITGAICLVVTAALLRGTASDRVTLLASVVVSGIGILLLEVFGVTQGVGEFGDLIRILAILGAMLGVAFWGAVWAGFGNRTATGLALAGVAAVWANWLLFSSAPGTSSGVRSGLWLDAHFIQLGAPFIMAAVSRGLWKYHPGGITHRPHPAFPLILDYEGEQRVGKKDQTGFLKPFSKSFVKAHGEELGIDLDWMLDPQTYEDYGVFYHEIVPQRIEEAEEEVVTKRGWRATTMKYLFGPRWKPIVDEAEISWTQYRTA